MTSKNSLFFPKRTLTIRGRIHVLERPLVMAILNITPDSFYRPDALTRAQDSPAAWVDQAGLLLEQGADWLDVGGMSTRPGAAVVPAAEEVQRVLPVLEALVRAFPHTVFSIDTVYSQTARACLEAGAGIINDVSAGQLDPDLWAVAAAYGAPYVLMHHKGIPAGKQNDDVPHIGLEVYDWMQAQLAACRRAGMLDVLIDPGFGFGKSLADNFRLLASLDAFRALDAPVLVGVSRKSMICRTLGVQPAEALNGTSVIHTLALLQGASVLRVHDPLEARQVLTLAEAYRSGQESNRHSPEEKPAFRP
ncbi:MAG: dihydropteroate synthase [Bacteroidetes bacterium]|nr:dihydropteroate synthase [Bacteroidota bacterium]